MGFPIRKFRIGRKVGGTKETLGNLSKNSKNPKGGLPLIGRERIGTQELRFKELRISLGRRFFNLTEGWGLGKGIGGLKNNPRKGGQKRLTDFTKGIWPNYRFKQGEGLSQGFFHTRVSNLLLNYFKRNLT